MAATIKKGKSIENDEVIKLKLETAAIVENILKNLDAKISTARLSRARLLNLLTKNFRLIPKKLLPLLNQSSISIQSLPELIKMKQFYQV